MIFGKEDLLLSQLQFVLSFPLHTCVSKFYFYICHSREGGNLFLRVLQRIQKKTPIAEQLFPLTFVQSQISAPEKISPPFEEAEGGTESKALFSFPPVKLRMA